LAGMGGVTAILSMWLSNTATTAMMLPIAMGVLGALHQARVSAGTASGPLDARTWPFATAMMLMIAYSASIGGLGTPVGSPPNLIGIGFIRNSTGVNIDFFTWMALAVPVVLLMAGVLLLLLYRLHPDGSPSRLGKADTRALLRDYVRQERQDLGRWTRAQVNTLAAFATAVFLGTLPGMFAVFGSASSPVALWLQTRFPEAVVALVAAMLLFVLPVGRDSNATLTWEDAVSIDWGTILLFGGGLTLGSLMFEDRKSTR